MEFETHFVYAQEERGIKKSPYSRAEREWTLKLTLFTPRQRDKNLELRGKETKFELTFIKKRQYFRTHFFT